MNESAKNQPDRQEEVDDTDEEHEGENQSQEDMDAVRWLLSSLSTEQRPKTESTHTLILEKPTIEAVAKYVKVRTCHTVGPPHCGMTKLTLHQHHIDYKCQEMDCHDRRRDIHECR